MRNKIVTPAPHEYPTYPMERPKGRDKETKSPVLPFPLVTNRVRVKTFTTFLDVPSAKDMSSAKDAEYPSPDSLIPVLAAIYKGLDAHQEHSVLIGLDGRLRLVGYKVLASGSKVSVDGSPLEVFRAALALNADSLVISHSHPFGDPVPSSEDIGIFAATSLFGGQLKLPVLDDIIYSPENGKWESVGRWLRTHPSSWQDVRTGFAVVADKLLSVGRIMADMPPRGFMR